MRLAATKRLCMHAKIFNKVKNNRHSSSDLIFVNDFVSLFLVRLSFNKSFILLLHHTVYLKLYFSLFESLEIIFALMAYRQLFDISILPHSKSVTQKIMATSNISCNLSRPT